MDHDPRVSTVPAFRLLNDNGNDYHYERIGTTNEERGDAEWCGQRAGRQERCRQGRWTETVADGAGGAAPQKLVIDPDMPLRARDVVALVLAGYLLTYVKRPRRLAPRSPHEGAECSPA